MGVLTRSSALEFNDASLRFGIGDDLLQVLPSPLELVQAFGTYVQKDAQRRAHLSRRMPGADEMVVLNEEVGVETPERAIAGLLRGLSLPQAIMVIDEYCGTFRQPRQEARGLYVEAYPYNRWHLYPKEAELEDAVSAAVYGIGPLTSTNDLLAYALGHARVDGVGAIKDAIPFCADGLRSYFEAEFHALSFMPPRWGGCGLPRPELNYHIDLPAGLQRIYGKPYILADDAWPDSRTAVELLGAADHGGDGIVDTALREKIYKDLRWTMIPVAWQEVQKLDLYMHMIRLLAKELGHRLRLECGEFERRQKWLHEELKFHGGNPAPNRKSYKELPW